MSYVQSRADPAARAKAAIMVGGIHALLGAGLIVGLSFTGVIDVGVNPKTIFIPEAKTPPPPPPDDVVESGPPYVPTTAPIPKRNLSDVSDSVIPQLDDFPQDDFVVRDPDPLPTPSFSPTPDPLPSPNFTPSAPIPRNAASWISTDDYPRIGIARQMEGTAHYRLVIGSNGRVNECEVTTSSGHAALDTATCRLLEQRARFDAAKDQTGRTVVSTYSGRVTWQLPD